MIIKTKTPLASTHNIVKLFVSVEDRYAVQATQERVCVILWSQKERLKWVKRYKLAYLVPEKLGTKRSLDFHTEFI